MNQPIGAKDEKHLEQILKELTEYLEHKGHPATKRNLIQAMFGGDYGSYADWLGGEHIYPVNQYETRWQAIKNWFKRLFT